MTNDLVKRLKEASFFATIMFCSWGFMAFLAYLGAAYLFSFLIIIFFICLFMDQDGESVE